MKNIYLILLPILFTTLCLAQGDDPCMLPPNFGNVYFGDPYM